MSGQLRGFGLTYDAATGACRNWYIDAEGEKRWADNDQPVVDDPIPYRITEAGKKALGDKA